MMPLRWKRAFLAVCAAFALLLSAGPAFPADPLADLRRERARLVEMRRKAEKTAAELTETLRKEKKTRARVGDLKSRLERQQRFIVEIDRKVSALTAEMDRTEAEVQALEARQEKTRRRLSDGVHATFLTAREPSYFPLDGSPAQELRREFVVRLLSKGRQHLESVTADRERKEEQLSGIEQRIEFSEKQMAKEKRVGETLQTRQEAERVELSRLEGQKKRKKAELADLRARIARMDSLVSRIEREARNRVVPRVIKRPGSPKSLRGKGAGATLRPTGSPESRGA